MSTYAISEGTKINGKFKLLARDMTSSDTCFNQNPNEHITRPEQERCAKILIIFNCLSISSAIE